MAAPQQNGVRKKATGAHKPTATTRLKHDYLMIMKDPVPYIRVAPLPSNMLEWHYVIDGPENTPYHKGIYHGKLKFPPDYPFRPPSFYMITPNGRFETNTKICLSISDFHPGSWNPTWNLSTLLIGLLSFMTEGRSTTGGIVSTDGFKRALARKSLDFNLNDKLFNELFPEVVEEIKKRLKEEEEEQQQATEAEAVVQTPARAEKANPPVAEVVGGGGQAAAAHSMTRLAVQGLFVLLVVGLGMLVYVALTGE